MGVPKRNNPKAHFSLSTSHDTPLRLRRMEDMTALSCHAIFGHVVHGCPVFALDVCIYRRFGGVPQLGNRFRFVFVSCVRAGEAKLRVREKSASLPLGLRVATFRAPAAPPVRASGVKLSPLSRSGPVLGRKNAFCVTRTRWFAR